MLHTPRTRRGMVTAPHHLASQAGLAILREGGTAIEAAIAAQAVLAVVYPHMTGLGGDGFWLIAEPGKLPVSIDGSGATGAQVDIAFCRAQGLEAIPATGPLAALTVAGAVSGWQLALDVSAQWGGRLPLSRLLADAIALARDGFVITRSQTQATTRNLDSLRAQPGFAAAFLTKGGRTAVEGGVLTQPALAATLDRLAAAGLDDFYRGDVARVVAEDLRAAGSPLRGEDLARHRGMRRRPLSLGLADGTLFNTAPPTQGLAALMILGLFQRLGPREIGGFSWIHGLAEATKQAFAVRDAHVTDPARMRIHATTYLSDPLLDRLALGIDPARAAPWPAAARPGDTAWLGAIDGQGRAVSCIQSLHQAFGSGVVLPNAGFAWHNRGIGFSLDETHHNALEPRRKPFHTLSPALARLKDGRVMVWGATGGDTQPQVQAQIFTRIVLGDAEVQDSLTAPRFALTGAAAGETLLVEERFPAAILDRLRAAGHAVTPVAAFDPLLGQAGALIRRPDGVLEGAADPRGDGLVAGF